MANTINMQEMRQINLFRKITHISTRFCFKYNETIFFCVPRHLVSKAIGKEASNVRRLNQILRKKIKIISAPNSIDDAKEFIAKIVEPVTFKELEIKDDKIIMTAGSTNKAALLGRNKRRLSEMQGIISDYFKRDFGIV